jgi:hypothetical protein
MHRKAGRVELLDQPREALRIEIKVAFLSVGLPWTSR